MTASRPVHSDSSVAPASLTTEGAPPRLKEAPSGLALLLQEPCNPSPVQGAALVTSASASSAHLLELAGDAGMQKVVNQVLGLTDGTRQQWHQSCINFPVLRQELQILLDEERFSEGGDKVWVSPIELQALGRLGGSEAVYMDTKSASGDCKFDSTGLRLESQSNFSSLRTTSCVFKGLWMYEATLVTAGIQQIGWATLRCPFTNEEGVGDAPDSFAFDGKRVRKWSVNCQQYGQPWVPGDVIGCCVDLEKGEVSFLRNGVSLGIAYTGIKRLDPGAAYFPAVSLSHGEACELNFGAKPLLYPVSGFRPLQPPPRIRAKRTVLIPPLQRLFSGSPGSGSPYSPERGGTEGPSTGPLAVPVPKQPSSALSPPPLELPFSSVPERPPWQGPVDMDSDSPEPLPNLTPVSSPKDEQIVPPPSDSAGSSRLLTLPELLASPRAKYLLNCLQRLLDMPIAPLPLKPRGRPPLRPTDVLLFASLLIEQLAPLLLATVPSHPPRVKASRLKQPKQAPSVPYYVIWDALVPWLLQLAESKPQTLEKALDILILCLEPHELNKVVSETLGALSFRCRTGTFSSERLPYTGGYLFLKLACLLVRRPEVLDCWWHGWGFEESLEGLLTKKAVNKNDLAALMPQVWWPTYRDVPGTEAAFKAATKSLTAAVDRIEELQVQLCMALLDFGPIASQPSVSDAGPGPSERQERAEASKPQAQVGSEPGRSSSQAGSGVREEGGEANRQGVSSQTAEGADAERRAGPEGGPSTSMASGQVSRGARGKNEGTGGGQTSAPARESLPQGGAFKHFLLWLLKKNRGVNRNVPPPGLSDNSVLVSVYFALLRILYLGGDGARSLGRGGVEKPRKGLLSRGEVRSFPVGLFLRPDGHYADLARLGGLYSHLLKEMPWTPADGREIAWVEKSGEVIPVGEERKEASRLDVGEGGRSSCEPMELGEQGHLPVSSGSVATTARPAADPTVTDDLSLTSPGHPSASGSLTGLSTVDSTLVLPVREAELLDVLILLYNLGIASNFKQASHFLQNQMHNIAQLDETDRQLAAARPDQQRTFQEVRTVFVEDVAENARCSAWSRVTLSSSWKQEAMYAACAWIVQMLLAVSKRGTVFSYVPEVYVESLVDSFHAIRRSDPPFLPPHSLLQNGLPPLVTFLVTHFTDARIANPDVRDVLLQSISVLLNYKEYVTAFERNRAARESLIPALLGSFDNRFWIPVSNILLRMCKGSGFGASRPSHHGLESPVFQGLIKSTFAAEVALASSFLNKLFNMLNWTVTEFSVAMKEMQDLLARHQVPELQQRKCAIMFELSCNLERILEFLAQELPQLFLAGPEMNLSRLCELVTFVLNHTTAGPDAGLFDRTLRLHMQSLEKISRPMILAPLIGIVINLAAAPARHPGLQHDVVRALAAADATAGSSANFDYLLDFNWSEAFKGDPSLHRVAELKSFVRRYKQELEDLRQKDALEKDRKAAAKGKAVSDSFGPADDGDMMEEDGELCPICYAYEVDTVFEPCLHQSCRRCIDRHLLNNKRCFFCNTEVNELVSK